MVTVDQARAALANVRYPGFSRDIVSFGLVRDVAANHGSISVTLQLTSGNQEIAQHLKSACEREIKALPGVERVVVQVEMPPGQAQPRAPGRAQLPGVKWIVAIASGKGGVGKSTVAVNLACALQKQGHAVGLLDCDIYGPSVPLMMGTRQRPHINEEERIIPPEHHQVKLMSIGFLVEGDSPVIWRGPMIVKTIQQFISSVDWGDLDFLLVDLPPGTGDAQLSLCQTVSLDGGVIVTTPQEASLGVVRKGIGMFQKVNVPLLGMVENMSFFTTPQGERIEIFGSGGGRREAARQGIPFLGEIPLFPEIGVGGDQGVPVTVSAPESAAAQPFYRIAEGLTARLLEAT